LRHSLAPHPGIDRLAHTFGSRYRAWKGNGRETEAGARRIKPPEGIPWCEQHASVDRALEDFVEGPLRLRIAKRDRGSKIEKEIRRALGQVEGNGRAVKGKGRGIARGSIRFARALRKSVVLERCNRRALHRD